MLWKSSTYSLIALLLTHLLVIAGAPRLTEVGIALLASSPASPPLRCPPYPPRADRARIFSATRGAAAC